MREERKEKEMRKETQVEERMFLAFEKVYGKDIEKFRYQFTTGRMLRDGKLLMHLYEQCGISHTKGTFTEKLFDYLNTWANFRCASLEELENAGWITDRIKQLAHVMVEYFENNFLELGDASEKNR